MKQQKKILLVTRSQDYTIMFVNLQKRSWRNKNTRKKPESVNGAPEAKTGSPKLFLKTAYQMEQNWI